MRAANLDDPTTECSGGAVLIGSEERRPMGS